MNKNKTYRQEFESMKFRNTNTNTIVSNYTILLYTFISFISNNVNRQEGYVQSIAKDADPSNIPDIIKVLTIVIDQNYDILNLKDEDKEKIVILRKYFGLILDNLDKYIRYKQHIVYDDEEDDDDPMLDCDMITETNNRLMDILSINENNLN